MKEFVISEAKAETAVLVIAVGTGTWGIAAVIPKYLSLRLVKLRKKEVILHIFS